MSTTFSICLSSSRLRRLRFPGLSCAIQETGDVARETRAIECKDVPVSTIISDQRLRGRWAITEFNCVTFENDHLFLFAQPLRHHARATEIAKFHFALILTMQFRKSATLYTAMTAGRKERIKMCVLWTTFSGVNEY